MDKLKKEVSSFNNLKTRFIETCEIWDSHGSDYEEHYLLGCDIMQIDRSFIFCQATEHQVPDDSILHLKTSQEIFLYIVQNLQEQI